MRINLEVHLRIDRNRGLKRGEFNVKREADIVQLTYDWVKYTKKETGYRKTIIEKVTWNEENNITDQVRQLNEAPLPDLNLPF